MGWGIFGKKKTTSTAASSSKTARVTKAPSRKAKLEARAFLRGNANPSAFASNVFGRTAAALEYVDALYRAGAKRVEVTGILAEDWRIKDEGGPYASTLLVALPASDAGKVRVLRAILEDDRRPDELSGGAILRLYWS